MRVLIKIQLMIAMVLIVISVYAPALWAETKTARVGFLTFSEAQVHPILDNMIRILAEHGWVEGKNLEIIRRVASGEPPQYDTAAKELAGLNLDFIYAAGAPGVRAQFAATKITPILTGDYSSDPIASGYANSYNRPGKNVGGVFLDAPQFAGKLLDILKDLVPRLKRVAVLWHPDTGNVHAQAITQAAKSFGIALQFYEIRSMEQVENAFARMQRKHQAIVILPTPMIYSNRQRIAELTLTHRLPSISMPRAFAEAGGLISYGPNGPEVDRRTFDLAAKILAGAKPADLPIETPSRFDFLINTTTAQKLGLKVPDRFLVGAELVR